MVLENIHEILRELGYRRAGRVTSADIWAKPVGHVLFTVVFVEDQLVWSNHARCQDGSGYKNLDRASLQLAADTSPKAAGTFIKLAEAAAKIARQAPSQFQFREDA